MCPGACPRMRLQRAVTPPIGPGRPVDVTKSSETTLCAAGVAAGCPSMRSPKRRRAAAARGALGRGLPVRCSVQADASIGPVREQLPPLLRREVAAADLAGEALQGRSIGWPLDRRGAL